MKGPWSRAEVGREEDRAIYLCLFFENAAHLMGSSAESVAAEEKRSPTAAGDTSLADIADAVILSDSRDAELLAVLSRLDKMMETDSRDKRVEALDPESCQPHEVRAAKRPFLSWFAFSVVLPPMSAIGRSESDHHEGGVGPAGLSADGRDEDRGGAGGVEQLATRGEREACGRDEKQENALTLTEFTLPRPQKAISFLRQAKSAWENLKR